MDNIKLNKPFKTNVKGKKYSVYVKGKKGKIVKVNFGQAGAPDFSSGSADSKQRKLFMKRMMGIKRKDGSFAYKDKTSPAYWSIVYGWNAP